MEARRLLTFEEWMTIYVYKILHYSKEIEQSEGLMKILRHDYQGYVKRINNE